MACSQLNSAGSRTWSDLVPRIKPSVQRCPELLIEKAIEQAAIEFCRRSGVLKRYFEIDTQRSVSDYYLELEACSTPIRIESVALDDGCLGGEYRPNPGIASCGCWSGCCGRLGFYSESPTHVRLTPAPGKDTERALKVTLVIAPAVDSCTLDDFLYQQWNEALVYGALARLYGMRGSSTKPNPWYSETDAIKYQRMFDQQRSRAKLEVDRNYAGGVIKARARRFL